MFLVALLLSSSLLLLLTLTMMPSTTLAASSSSVAAFASTTTTITRSKTGGACRKHSFASSGGSNRFLGQTMRFHPPSARKERKTGTSLNMFLGRDGIFGVGAPEVAVVVLVGYLVLGPSELYKVSKDIGKFVQNIRLLGSEASKSLETTMESQLELNEIRKAQRELNDAFGFRRSINTSEDNQPFEQQEVQDVPIASTVKTNKKKKIRKRRKKEAPAPAATPITNDIPMELEAPPPASAPALDNDTLRQDRMERLASGTQPEPSSWHADEAMLSQESSRAEQDRFQSQLSANDWNQQILANEDKLSPLATIMKKLALLEEEKRAADLRLREEFSLRTEIEETYYQDQRSLLEEAAAQVQTDAYISTNTPETNLTAAAATTSGSSAGENDSTN